MAFQFPWTNLHELNLDWFLSKFKQFTNNYLETTATAESVPYNAQPTVTVTGGELDDDTDIVNPFNFHFKIPAGMGILSLTITYNATNDTTEPITGWTTVKPTVNPGQYLWIKQTIILQNGVGQSYTYFVYYPVDGTTPTIDIDAYPTENSPNAVSSGGVWSDLNTIANLTSNNISWFEPTNTASRAYNINDYVIINGVLCAITAPVANGATLISGTNYTALGGNGGLANNIPKFYTINASPGVDYTFVFNTPGDCGLLFGSYSYSPGSRNIIQFVSAGDTAGNTGIESVKSNSNYTLTKVAKGITINSANTTHLTMLVMRGNGAWS